MLETTALAAAVGGVLSGIAAVAMAVLVFRAQSHTPWDPAE
ncbi:hypothetical protein OHT57_36650 [Streptomyces sp. NBC_00285]|nr:hypothetical protein [Streptomyces sp. NBC_00285]